MPLGGGARVDLIDERRHDPADRRICERIGCERPHREAQAIADDVDLEVEALVGDRRAGEAVESKAELFDSIDGDIESSGNPAEHKPSH